MKPTNQDLEPNADSAVSEDAIGKPKRIPHNKKHDGKVKLSTASRMSERESHLYKALLSEERGILQEHLASLPEEMKSIVLGMSSSDFHLALKTGLSKASGANFIYAMYSHKSGLTKLGMSKNPYRRIQQFRTRYSDIRLLITAMVEDVYKAETFLLRSFKDSRAYGEWFRLSDKQLDDLPNVFYQAREHVRDLEIQTTAVANQKITDGTSSKVYGLRMSEEDILKLKELTDRYPREMVTRVRGLIAEEGLRLFRQGKLPKLSEIQTKKTPKRLKVQLGDSEDIVRRAAKVANMSMSQFIKRAAANKARALLDNPDISDS